MHTQSQYAHTYILFISLCLSFSDPGQQSGFVVKIAQKNINIVKTYTPRIARRAYTIQIHIHAQDLSTRQVFFILLRTFHFVFGTLLYAMHFNMHQSPSYTLHILFPFWYSSYAICVKLHALSLTLTHTHHLFLHLSIGESSCNDFCLIRFFPQLIEILNDIHQ